MYENAFKMKWFLKVLILIITYGKLTSVYIKNVSIKTKSSQTPKCLLTFSSPALHYYTVKQFVPTHIPIKDLPLINFFSN